MVNNKLFFCLTAYFLVLCVFKFAIAGPINKGSILPSIAPLLLDESGGADTTAPTVPTELLATPVSSSQINLSWTASTDNVGVAGYKIYTGSGAFIKSVTGTSTSISALSPNTSYCFRVSAYDSADNESAQCAQQCATTQSEPQTITLDPQYDNQVYIKSLDPYAEDTVYTNGPLPVGCDWSWSKFFPERQDYVCGQGLIIFDLSAIAGKTVDSAALKLTTSSVGVGNYPRPWHIRALAAPWSPSTVTWNIVNPFAFYLNSEILLHPPGYGGQSELFEIDVTNIVQSWASGTWSNYGLIFGSSNYTFPYDTSFDAFEFYSLEDPGQDWPKLIVTYH